VRSFFYSKRERLADSLSLGSLKCPECDTESFTLTMEKELGLPKLMCVHCEGFYLYNKKDDTFITCQYSNVKPLYLEM